LGEGSDQPVTAVLYDDARLGAERVGERRDCDADRRLARNDRDLFESAEEDVRSTVPFDEAVEGFERTQLAGDRGPQRRSRK